MDWSHQYKLWQTALDENRRAAAHEILDQAQKCIPREKTSDRWGWFIDALEDEHTANFVLALFSRHPIPRKLKSAFLAAGVRFGDASSIKFFVIPCIESFGLDAVKRWFNETAPDLELDDLGTKREMAEYWFGYTNDNPRH